MNILVSILIIILIINIIKKRNIENFRSIDMDNSIHINYLKNNKSYFDYILDVRTKEEVNQGSLKNIINNPFINISYDEIDETTNISFNNKNINKYSKILIYCKSGRRSLIAYNKLKDKYINSVVVINGGYSELKDKFN